MLSRGKRVVICKVLKFVLRLFSCQSYQKKEMQALWKDSISEYEKNGKIKFMVKPCFVFNQFKYHVQVFVPSFLQVCRLNWQSLSRRYLNTTFDKLHKSCCERERKVL